MEKKKYEAPVVTRVEISFSDRIVSAGCDFLNPDIDYCGAGAENS